MTQSLSLCLCNQNQGKLEKSFPSSSTTPPPSPVVCGAKRGLSKCLYSSPYATAHLISLRSPLLAMSDKGHCPDSSWRDDQAGTSFTLSDQLGCCWVGEEI